jgi:hypothetical protein
MEKHPPIMVSPGAARKIPPAAQVLELLYDKLAEDDDGVHIARSDASIAQVAKLL